MSIDIPDTTAMSTSFNPGGGEDGGKAIQGNEVGGAADVAAHQSGRAPAVRTARLLQGARRSQVQGQGS